MKQFQFLGLCPRRDRRPRRLALEHLESREVLTGNVTAALAPNPVSGVDLKITGDNASNGVKVIQVGFNKFQVVGLDVAGATTVNGAPSKTFSGVTADINVDMLQGGDRVVVQRAAIRGNLHIETDGQVDHVNLVDVAIGGNLWIETGGGDDTVSIKNVAVGSFDDAANSAVHIDTGEGKDVVDIVRLVAKGGGYINTNVGNDTLSVRQSAFVKLDLIGDSGTDDFTVNAVAVRHALSIDMGDDADSLSITYTIAESASLDGGGGTADKIHRHNNLFGTGVTTNFEITVI